MQLPGRAPVFGHSAVEETPEWQRIKNLPRRIWTDEAAAALAVEMTRELKTPRGTMSLRPVQAVALYEAMQCGGLFAPIRVGGGKSLITLIMPLVLEAKRPILLLPAALIEKTWHERKTLELHWRLPTNLMLLSYEMLGRVNAAERFGYIEPDLIIADECHRLKGKRAGCTRRTVRYMKEHPETKFVALSGTVMKSSLKDFAHIIKWCLKDGAPMPHTEDEVTSWSDAVDEKVNPMARRSPGALLRL